MEATLSGQMTPKEHRHTAPITGMLISPFNPMQLITASLDGTVRVWDYLDSELHDCISIGQTIVAIDASTHWKQRLFVVAHKESSEHGASVIYSVQLGKSSPECHKAKTVRLGKARDVSLVRVSPDGAWLVALAGEKVIVLSLHDSGAGMQKYPTETKLTALAFHPDERVPRFATGETNGKIRIWYCLEQMTDEPLPQAANVPTTTLHWHAHAVSSLAYTADGTQLLSGGEEGVLVLWKVNSGNAGTEGREFVPRLGAPIVSIATARAHDAHLQEYAVRLADGSVVLVSSHTLRPTRTFSGVKSDATRMFLDKKAKRALRYPLALDAAAGQIVLTSGHPSTVQFIDMNTHAHVHDVEIVASNRVSRPEDEALAPPRVERVAFSPSRHQHAEWMATVDTRDGGEYTSEMSLKLWQWDTKQKSYVLNTRIDNPHGGEVTALSFSPVLGSGIDAFLLVTAGRDLQVKTWRMAQRALKGERTELYWVLRSSFAYRDAVPNHVAWAPDGSLFAVAQGVFVTLWDPQALVMQTRLACSMLKDVVSCEFVGRRGRFVSALGHNGRLVIWDLVSCTVVWSSPHNISAQVRYADGIVAVESGLPTLLHYYLPGRAPNCHVRTYTVDAPLSAPFLDVSRSSDASSSEAVHLLCYVKGALALISPEIDSRADALARSLHGVSLADRRSTIFDDLFGFAQVEEPVSAAVESQTGGDGGARALALFDVAPHLLPPMTMLVDDFFDALLPGKEAVEAQVVDDEAPVEVAAEAPKDAPAQERLLHARDADMSHLTSVFESMWAEHKPAPAPATATATAAAATTAAPAPRAKSKRRASRSM
ncbi:NET1-associated nuclear protein 1 [Malassezia cuniculi]|uniref:NET1-associated nuclear protein 1 n=1 Tax=Malassezia cuniculi TaxID=948313 RepID=A0AAF0J6X0_9BASI|nr:NET1-associated nuclear protein 1 [Malassezia cuniculi]